MSLKALHLISGGDTGGAKTHIFSLMKGLQGKVQAKIICFIKDSFYEDALEAGIDIEVIPQKRRSDMSVVDKIADIVNNEGYDIVHSHGARANTIAIFLKNKINVPMITTIHSDYLLDFKDSFYKNMIFTPINKYALKKFDYYVAVTENFKNMLISRGFSEDKIYTLYNGIDVEEVVHPVSREEFLKKYDISYNGEFIVGQAARLDGVKNLSMMIRTAKEALAINPKLLFLIAGSGDELSSLKALAKELGIEDRIKFLGFVKDNYSFFNAIDLNILTSISESFPYVILEAAKMSKPTVSTRVGGIQELIREGIDGYLVESNDYKMMAERIIELSTDVEKNKKLGKSINERVKEGFSVESMASKQIEIYTDIIGRRK